MEHSHKKRVGVIRGGAGEHYFSSLKKGGDILSHIFENLNHKYIVTDILIDKDHIWHVNGVPILPSNLLNKIDVAWNAGHPSFSNILNSLSIPTIGNSSFSHTLANSHSMLREHMKKIGLPMSRHMVIPLYQKDFDGPREKYAIKKAKEVFEKFGSPWIVKSYTPEANMAIHLAKTFNELVGAIEDGVRHEKSILVEEFIEGKVASVHSVVGFRTGDLPAQAGDIYTFPIVNSFPNFSGVLSQTEKDKLNTLVKDIHQHLGIKHYLKSDFIINPRGKVYLLDLELTPNLKPNSHFSQACESVNAKMHEVVEHILERALVI